MTELDLSDRAAIVEALTQRAAEAKLVDDARLFAAAAEHLAGEAGEHIRMQHTARFYEQRALDLLVEPIEFMRGRDAGPTGRVALAQTWATLALAAATDELNLPPVEMTQPLDDDETPTDAAALTTSAQLVLACGHRAEIEGIEVDEYNERVRLYGDDASWHCERCNDERPIEFVRKRRRVSS